MVLVQNSVNARYQTIPYPWLVFGEKVKVNTVFIRDSTGVSDSTLILFGGALSHGVQVIHLLTNPVFLFYCQTSLILGFNYPQLGFAGWAFENVGRVYRLFPRSKFGRVLLKAQRRT